MKIGKLKIAVNICYKSNYVLLYTLIYHKKDLVKTIFFEKDNLQFTICLLAIPNLHSFAQ